MTPPPLKLCSSLTRIGVFVRWIFPLFAAFSKFPNALAHQSLSFQYGQSLATMLRSFVRQPWPRTPILTPPPLDLFTFVHGSTLGVVEFAVVCRF